MNKQERLKAAEAAYPEFPNGGIENRNRDIHCHNKRKAFIKGAEAEAESNQKDNILIPLWKFKIIENALRMTNNIHNTYKRVSAYDREVDQAYGFAKECLNQE